MAIEEDLSDNYLGLSLSISDSGAFCMQPQLHAAPGLYGVRDFPTFMHYSSYVSMSVKRSLVLGIMARVDTFTLPVDNKPRVLGDMIFRLAQEGAFPLWRVRKWISDGAERGRPWARMVASIL
jgi:hypothetical protein